MPAPSTDVTSVIRQLEQNIASKNHKTSASLLSKAKLALLQHNALVPTPQTSPPLLHAAQTVLELGALISIRLQDPAAFTRYFQQLQPFYAVKKSGQSQRSKITGLYLLLLLSQGDYAGFHTELEALEVAFAEDGKGKGVDEDPFVQYPVRLEQWLMEGSYDRVWEETKGRSPAGEFAIFSDVLIGTIRAEVASCSEKTYPSIPVTNAKNLFFLDSEGSVVGFAKERGWEVHDGRIYFPALETTSSENDILSASGTVIENTLGYARELETIV